MKSVKFLHLHYVASAILSDIGFTNILQRKSDIENLIAFHCVNTRKLKKKKIYAKNFRNVYFTDCQSDF